MSTWETKFKIYGALEKRLTHMPFTHAFTGSNPVRVTICKHNLNIVEVFLYQNKKIKKIKKTLAIVKKP